MSSNTLNGWVVLDKEAGMTSNRANTRLRHILGCKGTGFAGTLDPLATGVLPIAVGEATKLLPYLMHRSKAYTFTIQWGQHRATGDLEGEVLATSLETPSQEQINAALPAFHGQIQQVPPAHSAVKIQGVRACDRVRRGEEVTLQPRQVHIMAWQMTHHDAAARQTGFQVTCGSGTYVRSLAVDLAKALGCFGYVTHLRRISVGPFQVQHAFSLASLEELGHSTLGRALLPLAVVLDDISDIAVTEDQAWMLRQGRSCPVDAQPFQEGERVWVHQGNTRHVIAMGDIREGKLWPVRILHT